MENNNNKGNGVGIFYGVIGVATLVVTIIGATFAFFSAQVNSAADAVQAGSSQVKNLTLAFEDNIKTDLIPVLETDNKFASFVGLADGKCEDVNGNDICSVYNFTVTNPNTVAQQVYFYFEPQTNGFTNLWYAVFKGTPADGSYNVNEAVSRPTTDTDGSTIIDGRDVADGKVVVAKTQLTKGSTTRIAWTDLAQVIPAGETATYTIVVWIHETGSEQNVDAGQSFKAGVRIATGIVDENGVVTSGGVTGQLSTTVSSQ